jgi:hypothetical protein
MVESQYLRKSGTVKGENGLNDSLRVYLKDHGFVEFDPGNGFSRGTFGSPRGTVLVTCDPYSKEMNVHIGTTDTSFLEEFVVNFPKVPLR